MIRTATLVNAMAVDWTSGAVGGNRSAAAISTASMASELMTRILVYSISVAVASAEAATASSTSANRSSDWSPWRKARSAASIASCPSPHG
ncbi:hypothetical protein [Nocardia sp. NPDC051833]|uniref:hypothetical protein n=1 Tax=Nocardia sp. NPDC051833 TaxID=3155674 RepID=UPI0034418A31